MTSSHAPYSPRTKTTWFSLLVGVFFSLSAGCSDVDTNRLPALEGGNLAPAHSSQSSSCEPGDEKKCGHTVAQEHEILSCYEGVRTCQKDGTWGSCKDGTVTTKRVPQSLLLPVDSFELGTYSTLALSSAAAENCLDACDPYCRHFEEPAPELGTITGRVVNTPFPGSGSMCDHSLCDTADGDPLVATCDPCVADVCAVRPSCCTTTWDSSCEDLVYSECAGTQPPFDLCDFGVFSLSSVVTRNRPSAGAAIGAVGNVTIGTDATPSMIVTTGNLHIESPNGKNITAPGGVWVKGNATAQNGGGARYISNWHVGGSINLNGGNTIQGNVRAGSTPMGVTITGSTTVTSVKPQIDIPTTIPALPSTCPGGSNYMVDNGTRQIGPGNYGTITMQNEAKLVLNGPGTYTFRALNGNANRGGIQIGTSSTAGTYKLIICGDFRLGNNMNIIDYSASPTNRTAVTPVLSNPERLVIHVGGKVDFGTDVKFTGVMMVPNGKYTGADRATVNGAIWAKDFQSGTDMAATPISASACEALELETTTRTCPVELSPGLPPSENEPCQSGADCQINQRCDDVATGSCAHDKCDTGARLAASCDECVALICAADPSCCTGTWDSDCVDMVGTVCDATCGTTGAGSCVSNDDGWVDSTCAGYDLAAAYVCDNQVPVCNHGSSAFPAGPVTVGYWPLSDSQFATASPENSLGGTCTGMVSEIAPGTCAYLPCAIPSGADYTVMIDPKDALHECAGRRLDNWSWRDDDFTCVSGTSYIELEYEADCPDGTSALWKNLTWTCVVPVGSKIEFGAKVGENLSDLSSESYVSLGVAEQGAEDSTTCSIGSSAPGCPEGITDALDLGRYQGQAISLRVETDYAGGIPQVDDWTISYTCQIDE